jgi:hypothetical protein
MNELLALLFVVVLLAVGVCIGLFAKLENVEERRRRLAAREAELQAQWDALSSVNRLSWAYWLARQRLRDEARRHQS